MSTLECVTTTTERVYLGVALSGSSIRVASSLGQRSAISAEGTRSPEDWVELATYGVPLPEPHILLACVAVPSGYSPALRRKIVEAARQAEWDGVLLVKTLAAARRALRSQTPEELALVVVDPEVTSVGLLQGVGSSPAHDDPVRAIPGREAREVAVSLRVMLKQLPRDEQRRMLQQVVVTGDAHEIDRIGQRNFERELEALGARKVGFVLDPYLIAQGAAQLAEETEPGIWRRLRRKRG